MTFSIRFLPLLLALIAAGMMACGQTESSPVADEQEHPAEAAVKDIRPAIKDSLDRTGWVVKGYGTHPISIAVPKPLVGMGDQVPESAKKFVLRNETFSGIHGDDFQMIVNTIEYVSTVPVDLNAIAASAADQIRSDVAVSHFESTETPITVSGLQGIRQDGRLFRDGLIHYWCNTLVQRGQEVYQVMVMYPETYVLGAGDAEAMMHSLRLD
ncbi:MAG: hypothetical protein K9I85_11335 [Saprospiraceae bacterium]|nr:hypothetical protein [Saprospiraceae bacterium]